MAVIKAAGGGGLIVALSLLTQNCHFQFESLVIALEADVSVGCKAFSYLQLSPYSFPSGLSKV